MKMTLDQLVDIQCILWKMLFNKDIAWDNVSCETAQGILKGNKKLFASRFIRFLANGGRTISSLKVPPVPFGTMEIVEWLGEGWAFFRDKASLAPSTVDWDKVDFLDCRRKGGDSIDGKEFLLCLQAFGRKAYGLTHCMGLWLNYESCQDKAVSVLENLYEEKGITCIYFFGDVLQDPDGGHFAAYLERDDRGRWHRGKFPLALSLNKRDLAAVFQQVQ